MTRSCTTVDLSAYDRTAAAVEKDPAGQGKFLTVTSWVDGTRARTTARSFTFESDEPSPLGGTDQAIDPMELLLASVGTCLSIGWVTHAAKRGIDFRDLRIEVEGDHDLRGYLGIGTETRPGFGAIRYTVHVDTDASDAVLEEILKAAEAGSPVTDNVASATPVGGSISKAS